MHTDQSSEISIMAALDPAAIRNGNATTTGATIAISGFETLTFAVQSGVITDGTLTSAIFGSNDNFGTETQLTAAQLIGTAPSFAITDDSVCKRVGVNHALAGYKAYRIKVTQAAATTGGFYCAVAVLGAPRFAPVA